jgi:NADH-quinone oxidoreductase subunit N
MTDIAFAPIAAELLVLLGAMAILLLAVTLKWEMKGLLGLSYAALAGGVIFSVMQWARVDDLGPQLNWTGPDGVTPLIVMDHFSAMAGIAVYTVAFLAVVGASSLVQTLGRRGAEFLALVLLATAGLHLMTSAANLIMLFIGLETASIALYVIAGFIRNGERSDESAMKYFLLGSFASAIFLYGVALTFAATGSTSLYGPGSIESFLATDVFRNLVSSGGESGVLLLGVALMVVGLGFKISAAPFHQWAPDVYQGAPGGAVPLMSAGVKVAGVAATARILVGAFGTPVGTGLWNDAVAAIAVLSVVVGTVLAIAQTDIKRMLAYSGVAHAGFMLTGLVSGVGGVPAVWFYLATYAIQLVGAFLVTVIVSGPRTGASPLTDYQGLASRQPGVALAMAILMLGLAGIPLTAGFVGKVGVFSAAIDAGFLWLAIAGLVVAVAGLFFYLRVIVIMYFQTAPVAAEGPGAATLHGGEPDTSSQAVLGFAVGVTVVLGVVPWPLLNLLENALPL